MDHGALRDDSFDLLALCGDGSFCVSPGDVSPRDAALRADDSFVAAPLSVLAATAALRGAAFDDPLEAVKQGRRLGTAVPATWDPAPGLLAVPVFRRLGDDAFPLSAAADAECAQVLAETFRSCFGPEPPPTVAGMLRVVADRSNYEVLSVTRLQNPTRYSMHRHFGRSYAVDGARKVYHGTTQGSASAIARVGFRNAASQRAKFGKGIYAASSVWEALAYAQPEGPSNAQTVLVADLLQGPTAVGSENLADFGQDGEGAQVLTTTNPEGKIFCAAYEDQLYAHYSVTARFVLERTHLLTAHLVVDVYHPSLWSLIKTRRDTQPAARKPIFALAPPVPGPGGALPAPPRVRELASHMGLKQGDAVRVVRTLKRFVFCQGAGGRIAKIMKDGHVHFCVALDSPELRERVALGNQRRAYEWHAEPAWLRCSVSHIETVTAGPVGAPAAPAALAAVPAKAEAKAEAEAKADAKDTVAGAAAVPAARSLGKRKAPESRPRAP